MYTPHPYGNGFYYAPTPPSPQDRERKNLRSSASAVGALLLAHIATMQLLYPTVIDILIAVGYLQKNAKNEPTLGLDNTTYLLLYGVVYALVMVLPLLIILFQKKSESQKTQSSYFFFKKISSIHCLPSELCPVALVFSAFWAVSAFVCWQIL